MKRVLASSQSLEIAIQKIAANELKKACIILENRPTKPYYEFCARFITKFAEQHTVHFFGSVFTYLLKDKIRWKELVGILYACFTKTSMHETSTDYLQFFDHRCAHEPRLENPPSVTKPVNIVGDVDFYVWIEHVLEAIATENVMKAINYTILLYVISYRKDSLFYRFPYEKKRRFPVTPIHALMMNVREFSAAKHKHEIFFPMEKMNDPSVYVLYVLSRMFKHPFSEVTPAEVGGYDAEGLHDEDLFECMRGTSAMPTEVFLINKSFEEEFAKNPEFTQKMFDEFKLGFAPNTPSRGKVLDGMLKEVLGNVLRVSIFPGVDTSTSELQLYSTEKHVTARAGVIFDAVSRSLQSPDAFLLTSRKNGGVALIATSKDPKHVYLGLFPSLPRHLIARQDAFVKMGATSMLLGKPVVSRNNTRFFLQYESFLDKNPENWKVVSSKHRPVIIADLSGVKMFIYNKSAFEGMIQDPVFVKTLVLRWILNCDPIDFHSIVMVGNTWKITGIHRSGVDKIPETGELTLFSCFFDTSDAMVELECLSLMRKHQTMFQEAITEISMHREEIMEIFEENFSSYFLPSDMNARFNYLLHQVNA